MEAYNANLPAPARIKIIAGVSITEVIMPAGARLAGVVDPPSQVVAGGSKTNQGFNAGPGETTVEEGAVWTVATLGSIPPDLPETVNTLRSVLRMHCRRDLLSIAKEVVDWCMGLLPLKGSSRHESQPTCQRIQQWRESSQTEANLLLEAFHLPATEASAMAVDNMCQERNLSQHSTSLNGLDARVREACQTLTSFPDLVDAEPVASQLVLNYSSGRTYLIQHNNQAFRDVQRQARRTTWS